MAEKLTDPSKPAHEIIEVLEDGDAIRNDGVGLQAANKNPWYVLATIYGEQPEGASFDKGLAAKNRRAWNGWFCAELSEEERADRAERAGLDVADLMPLGKGELVDISNRFRERLKDENAELPDRDGNIDFSKLHFSRFVNFEKFVFEKYCNFSFATFSDGADFRSSMFSNDSDFSSVTFSGYTDFYSSTFNRQALFASSVFSGTADFSCLTFNSTVDFNFATFNCIAHFHSSLFKSFAIFCSSSFRGHANFYSTTFCHTADFSRYKDLDNKKALYPVRFYHQADFRSAKFNFITLFSEAQFISAVPKFHAAELYDESIFPIPDKYTDNWPPLKGSVKVEGQGEPIPAMPAADQKRAYNRLRLFMNKSLQIDEEQFFHRQEMRCKREIEKKWWMRCLYDIFEGVSDYGISIGRPAFWLVVFWLFGMIAKLKPAADGWWPDYHSILPAMGWSFANLFSFFGFQRRYFDEEKLIMLLKLVGGVQTVAGFILLFFLGLGLRNRFRLR